LSYRRAPEAA